MTEKGPNISNMRNRVEFSRNNPQQDATTGEFVDNWETYTPAWASFRLISGTLLQVQQANTLAPVRSYAVECRWFPGLSQTDRMTWGDRVFTVNSFDDANGTRQFWSIVVTEALR